MANCPKLKKRIAETYNWRQSVQIIFANFRVDIGHANYAILASLKNEPGPHIFAKRGICRYLKYLTGYRWLKGRVIALNLIRI